MAQDTEHTEILKQYADGPALIESAVSGLDDAVLDTRKSSGGWSIREIVHHVVDGDDIWKWCIKSALGNDGGEFTFAWYWALQQDVWARRWQYSTRQLDVTLNLFRANRQHVLQLLSHMPDAWQRSCRIPTRDGRIEVVTVDRAVKIQVEHVTHHTKQITAIRELCGGV